MLSVRELQEKDIPKLVSYWHSGDEAYWLGMGADINKIPDKSVFTALLKKQLSLSYPLKQAYCIIWENDGLAIGHTNINKITFGKEASMHLHLWSKENRVKGMGTRLVAMSLPYFFTNFRLERLICEPYALNLAPNKTLAKVGFQFIKEYRTIPGQVNFEQLIKRWELNKTDFLRISQKETSTK